ncbi:YodL domain-containing protein [Enterocloster bolteae]|uniref:YodL domain-containing protein n=1 Tax=Enterocloster bolteae TaxID=208479 RepID=UPI0028DB3A0D|nr:YodL domain-containing protein [Enterocloster bolteae]
MRITLYQIVPELDNDRLIFQGLLTVKAAGNSRVPAQIYKSVYQGEVNAKTLEDVFYIFNMAHPKGYCGRSLSVSDVVEVFRSSEESEFFFCESAGFVRIEFDKNRTAHR